MKKQIFTIALMEDKDYLNLHKQFSNIKEEDLHNSLGFADKESGEAYIRKTACKDVDNATIQHEIQELMSETSEHEKDGIRFGWFRKIFGFSSQPAARIVLPALAAMIPGVGPIVSGLLAAGTSAATQKLTTGKISPVQTALAGVGGGLLKGAMAPGIEVAKEAGKGVLGQVGAGLQSAVGITPAGATKTAGVIAPTAKAGTIMAGGPLETYAGGGSVLAQSLGNISKAAPAVSSWAAPAVQAATQAPTAGPLAPAGGLQIAPLPGQTLPAELSNIIGATPQGLGTPWVPPVTTPGAVPPTAPTTLIGQAKGLATPQNILGAASIMGSLATPSPQFQMPSTVEDIRKKLLEQTQVDPVTGEMKPGGLTELGKQAQVELGNILKSTPQELYPTASDAYYQAALRRTRESYATAKENLDAAYNLAGVHGTGEHLAAQNKLAQQLTNVESDLFAQTEQRNFELARSAKYQAIQDSLGVDRDVMDDLLGLSGLDVATAAMIYGAQAKDVQSLRESLGTLGVELILRGTTGAGKQPMINMTLGK